MQNEKRNLIILFSVCLLVIVVFGGSLLFGIFSFVKNESDILLNENMSDTHDSSSTTGTESPLLSSIFQGVQDSTGTGFPPTQPQTFVWNDSMEPQPNTVTVQGIGSSSTTVLTLGVLADTKKRIGDYFLHEGYKRNDITTDDSVGYSKDNVACLVSSEEGYANPGTLFKVSNPVYITMTCGFLK